MSVCVNICKIYRKFNQKQQKNYEQMKQFVSEISRELSQRVLSTGLALVCSLHYNTRSQCKLQRPTSGVNLMLPPVNCLLKHFSNGLKLYRYQKWVKFLNSLSKWINSLSVSESNTKYSIHTSTGNTFLTFKNKGNPTTPVHNIVISFMRNLTIFFLMCMSINLLQNTLKWKSKHAWHCGRLPYRYYSKD